LNELHETEKYLEELSKLDLDSIVTQETEKDKSENKGV
jgi:hypothetical protein